MPRSLAVQPRRSGRSRKTRPPARASSPPSLLACLGRGHGGGQQGLRHSALRQVQDVQHLERDRPAEGNAFSIIIPIRVPTRSWPLPPCRPRIASPEQIYFPGPDDQDGRTSRAGRGDRKDARLGREPRSKASCAPSRSDFGRHHRAAFRSSWEAACFGVVYGDDLVWPFDIEFVARSHRSGPASPMINRSCWPASSVTSAS